ncbi:MAG: hypothetical protein ACKVY0_29925 [Prosthecobacter sp.]|uniref:hypothetical protein n=1 Tax=Prosthecobacter sp. TaxID=1965333 RepID=UPI0039031559
MSKAEFKKHVERMRQTRERWVLTDPDKTRLQMASNRAMRLSLEQATLSSSSKP